MMMLAKKKTEIKMEEPIEEKEEIKAEEPKPEVEAEPEVKKHKTLSDIPGVGPATVEKLEIVGYKDLMSVAIATVGEIIEVTGMTEGTAKKVIGAARASLDMGFETGIQLLEKRKLIMKLTTGNAGFDELMGGGFETGAITECYGEFGSGKTQIGHILAVNIQKQDPGAKVVYIDTESTFRPERIIELAEGVGLDPQKVLENIKVARALNSDHQMLLVERSDELVKEDNVKLVIVDSLTAHFRAEYVGRGTLAERQQKLNRHMRDLSRLSTLNNVCVYVTNQVMSKPDQFFGDPTQAIGGHIVAHASTFRIYLRKGKKGSRVAKLVDSPNLPEGECGFFVAKEGLTDI